MHPQVTCSDASGDGGGICASAGTTAVGSVIAAGALRGQLPEARLDGGILVIGLFDGIGALRVAIDALKVPVSGYISVEKHDPAGRVVEKHFAGVVRYPRVEDITPETVKEWSTRYSQTSLVVIGAGPPCQGVSGLNWDRKGALKDERSCLFKEVPRIRDEVKKHFPWCPTYVMMESVASMDKVDRDIMTQAIGCLPLKCDAGTFTWCHRPRLYRCDWEIIAAEGYHLSTETGTGLNTLTLQGSQDFSDVIRAGWWKVDPSKAFPTFTTSRPRSVPGRKPAGVQQCSLTELQRWASDSHRFPPYQYCEVHCLVNKSNTLRLADVAERELMMGFPLHYTAGCLAKGKQKGPEYNDCRLTLLGNSWSVPVVACLLLQLFARLGLVKWCSPQNVLESLRPGYCPTAQGRLFRLPLNKPGQSGSDCSQELAKKLGNLISVKGEDIMLTTPSTQLARFQRLRATVPGRCWKWKIVAGWTWKRKGDHINGLELRAILTSLKWRLEHCQHFKTRFIHLTDSLVCLHSLSRGRSSSKKLRRPMSRINALILVSGTQPLWGYIHTDQNPADKPSRWGQRVRTKFRNNAKRKILEQSEAKDRAKQRQNLGTLRQLTVQPATRKRYDNATTAFFLFLKQEGIVIPTRKEDLDPILCDYLEYLWSTGVGRGQANDTVAGLQDVQPNLRGRLPGAWRLLKTWAVNEIPNRAPPLPEQVVQAMAGWAFFHGHYSFGISLILGFYTMLRSGELLGLRSSHILSSPAERQVLISLGFTKGGKRQGAAESVILGVERAVQLVQRWKKLASPSTSVTDTPSKWRSRFSECLKALGLERFEFRPYSLRRGGATWWFSKHHSLDRILVQGRWLAHKTARIYLNEGLAMLARTNIDFRDPTLAGFLQIYQNTCSSLSFTTLEPPAKAGRAGGRGKKAKSRVRKRVKNFFTCAFGFDFGVDR